MLQVTPRRPQLVPPKPVVRHHMREVDGAVNPSYDVVLGAPSPPRRVGAEPTPPDPPSTHSNPRSDCRRSHRVDPFDVASHDDVELEVGVVVVPVLLCHPQGGEIEGTLSLGVDLALML